MAAPLLDSLFVGPGGLCGGRVHDGSVWSLDHMVVCGYRCEQYKAAEAPAAGDLKVRTYVFNVDALPGI